MRSNIKNYLFIAVLLSTSSLSWAENAMEIGVSGSYFDYEEVGSAGKILNTEKGGLYGSWLSYRVESDAVAYSLSWSLDNNSVQYTGVTTTGNIAKSTTDERISNILLKCEYLLPEMSSVYAGAGYRYWRRNIQSAILPGGTVAAGLLEKYHWPYIAAGITKKIKTSEKLGILLDANVKYAIKPNLDVKFKNGATNNVNVGQGRTWGLSASVSAWRLSENGTNKLVLTPYIDYWHSDRGDATALTSNGVVVGSVLEPESRTIQTGLRVSLFF